MPSCWMMGWVGQSRWTEVNILPPSATEAERLLTRVVDPLVHDVLQKAPDRWDRWHFFWEPELRLRFRWASGVELGNCRETVNAHLAKAQGRGKIASWAEVPYDGEAADYGHQVWEAVIADWMSGSELALAIIKAGKRLARGRSFYWERHQHLFADQLDVPEVTLCLWQARARLEQFWPGGNPPALAATRHWRVWVR